MNSNDGVHTGLSKKDFQIKLSKGVSIIEVQ
jgi:hypothetical protein